MNLVKIPLFSLVLVTFFCLIVQVAESNDYYGHNKCCGPKVLLKKEVGPEVDGGYEHVGEDHWSYTK